MSAASPPDQSKLQVQPSGCMLLFDSGLQHLLWIAENSLHMLDIAPTEALQRHPKALLGNKLHQQIIGQAADAADHLSIEVWRQLRGRRCRFNVSVWFTEQYLVVEFEPAAMLSEQPLFAMTNHWLSRLARAKSSDGLAEVLVAALQQVSGFDRISLHRFDSQANSDVIAEYCLPSVTALLGKSFPGNTSMQLVQAQLRLHAQISVADTAAKPVALLAADNSLPEPAACSVPGYLRAMPEAYCQMLTGLGVKSVLIIGIFQEQRLWGSVNCHAFNQQTTSLVVRDALFNLVQMATQRLFLLKTEEQTVYLRQVMNSRELISTDSKNLQQASELFNEYASNWLKLFDACGVVVVHQEDIATQGQLPHGRTLRTLIKWLSDNHLRPGYWSTTALAGLLPELAADLNGCSGLLAVPLPFDRDKPGWLLLFRTEQIQQRWWAVQPAHLDASHCIEGNNGHQNLWQETLTGHSRPWTELESRAALDLGEDLAVAIAVEHISALNERFQQTNQRLEQLAHTDTLTQIWNRYRMELALDNELAAAERYGRACSLMLFDIDYFKQVNDQYGHEVGDAVLAGVAWEVKTLLRSTDYLGRWGGEEFIVLTSNTAIQEAAQLAERLRLHISQLQLDKVGSITVSIGVAEWQVGDSRRSLLERADHAMYDAKQSGRNRVRLAQ